MGLAAIRASADERDREANDWWMETGPAWRERCSTPTLDELGVGRNLRSLGSRVIYRRSVTARGAACVSDRLEHQLVRAKPTTLSRRQRSRL